MKKKKKNIEDLNEAMSVGQDGSISSTPDPDANFPYQIGDYVDGFMGFGKIKKIELVNDGIVMVYFKDPAFPNSTLVLQQDDTTGDWHPMGRREPDGGDIFEAMAVGRDGSFKEIPDEQDGFPYNEGDIIPEYEDFGEVKEIHKINDEEVQVELGDDNFWSTSVIKYIISPRTGEWEIDDVQLDYDRINDPAFPGDKCKYMDCDEEGNPTDEYGGDYYENGVPKEKGNIGHENDNDFEDGDDWKKNARGFDYDNDVDHALVNQVRNWATSNREFMNEYLPRIKAIRQKNPGISLESVYQTVAEKAVLGFLDGNEEEYGKIAAHDIEAIAEFLQVDFEEKLSLNEAMVVGADGSFNIEEEKLPQGEFEYSITFTDITPESAEEGDFADQGYAVEPTIGALYDIIEEAISNYGVYNKVSYGGRDLAWESEFEVVDYQKGIQRAYTLHLKGDFTEEQVERLDEIIGSGRMPNEEVFYGIEEEKDETANPHHVRELELYVSNTSVPYAYVVNVMKNSDDKIDAAFRCAAWAAKKYSKDYSNGEDLFNDEEIKALAKYIFTNMEEDWNPDGINEAMMVGAQDEELNEDTVYGMDFVNTTTDAPTRPGAAPEEENKQTQKAETRIGENEILKEATQPMENRKLKLEEVKQLNDKEFGEYSQVKYKKYLSLNEGKEVISFEEWHKQLSKLVERKKILKEEPMVAASPAPTKTSGVDMNLVKWFIQKLRAAGKTQLENLIAWSSGNLSVDVHNSDVTYGYTQHNKKIIKLEPVVKQAWFRGHAGGQTPIPLEKVYALFESESKEWPAQPKEGKEGKVSGTKEGAKKIYNAQDEPDFDTEPTYDNKEEWKKTLKAACPGATFKEEGEVTIATKKSTKVGEWKNGLGRIYTTCLFDDIDAEEEAAIDFEFDGDKVSLKEADDKENCPSCGGSGEHAQETSEDDLRDSRQCGHCKGEGKMTKADRQKYKDDYEYLDEAELCEDEMLFDDSDPLLQEEMDWTGEGMKDSMQGEGWSTSSDELNENWGDENDADYENDESTTYQTSPIEECTTTANMPAFDTAVGGVHKRKVNESFDKKPLPQKGTPEWHQLKIAKDTMKMNDVMATMMGGMSKDEARQLLAQYGIVINEGLVVGKQGMYDDPNQSRGYEDNYEVCQQCNEEVVADDEGRYDCSICGHHGEFALMDKKKNESKKADETKELLEFKKYVESRYNVTESAKKSVEGFVKFIQSFPYSTQSRLIEGFEKAKEEGLNEYAEATYDENTCGECGGKKGGCACPPKKEKPLNEVGFNQNGEPMGFPDDDDWGDAENSLEFDGEEWIQNELNHGSVDQEADYDQYGEEEGDEALLLNDYLPTDEEEKLDEDKGVCDVCFKDVKYCTCDFDADPEYDKYNALDEDIRMRYKKDWVDNEELPTDNNEVHWTGKGGNPIRLKKGIEPDPNGKFEKGAAPMPQHEPTPTQFPGGHPMRIKHPSKWTEEEWKDYVTKLGGNNINEAVENLLSEDASISAMFSAKEEGAEAFRQGKPKGANPYHGAPFEFNDWNAGWQEAFEAGGGQAQPTPSAAANDGFISEDIKKKNKKK
jgi:hypothetical protein